MKCHCGVEFEPIRSNQVHCSDKCRLAAHLKRRNAEMRKAIIGRHLYHMQGELAAAKLEPFTNADID